MSRQRFVVFSILLIHAILVGWIGLRTSPTIDEPGHLAAGVYVWKSGRFDLFGIHPPLVRSIAAVPVVLAGAKTDWRSYERGPGVRSEWRVGGDFFTANGLAGFWYMTLARWAVIPLTLVGGYVCYRWAFALYGAGAGLAALVLWSMCPNVTALAATITTDVAAAVGGVAAGYGFWRWLKSPTWSRAWCAGLVLGFAQLTKTTWIVLYALWPLVWLVWLVARRRQRDLPSWPRQMAQGATMFLMAVWIVNSAYGFQGTCKRLGDYTFVSRSLAFVESPLEGGRGGNRFAGQWLGMVPVPLPEDYVLGIDLQKLYFEQPKHAYLCGHWLIPAPWWYYLYGAVMKVPLGTWLLGILAGVLTAARAAGRHRVLPLEASRAGPTGYSAGWLDELTLLAPGLVVFALASSQRSLNLTFRYALPCLPFAFIWMSKVARAVPLGNRVAAVIGGAALTWSVGSSLWVYPHSLSYCSEVAGGPVEGHYHVIDANFDWGQDLLYLKRWLNDHPEASPLHMSCFTFLRPAHFAIESFRMPFKPGTGGRRDGEAADPSRIGPLPGWYAVSASSFRNVWDSSEYFLRFRPVAMAGYSIYIYHITLEEANRVRRDLGLPELPGA